MKISGTRGPAVAVMAKVPRPGTVKTRLARTLGAEAACDLYRAFVVDLDERLARLAYPCLWFHWPDEPRFGGLVGGATVVLAQRGRGLGERMAAAFGDAFDRGFGPVVMIGADVPHVPLERLAEAVRRLESGAEVVIGPAADGGYYLLGLRAPTPAVLHDIPWGGPDVYETSLCRARAAGLKTVELAPWFDIDEHGDLERLSQVLSRNATLDLPRTRRVLRSVGLFRDT